MQEEERIYLVDRDKAWWRMLEKIQRAILFVTVVSVMFIISYGAILRYVFQKDFFGIEDVILVIAFWMYFIGGSYGSYTGNHVSAEVIPAYIKDKKVRNIVLLVKSAVSVGLSWLFSYWGFNLFLWGVIQKGKTATLGIPLVVPQSAIFVGLVLMSLYITVYFIEDVLLFKRNNQTDLIMNKGEL
ncbi:MAG TPA: TRAP transporter small permease [Clostridia bacterium]|nr:TRAP transporter small permease [Clostridia bacterium]